MGLMKKLTSIVVVSSLVLSLVGTAVAADVPALSGQAACDRMIALKVLKGKAADNACALNDEISRAELVTIMVRAFGKEGDAALLNGAAAFPDTATHWASGNIAMAKNLVAAAGSDPIGMPDGTFNPNGKLTPAQAVAFVMKFMGVKRDATKSWPNDYLDRAVELGIISSTIRDSLLSTLPGNASRGTVFVILDFAFSAHVKEGETVYTKYTDPSKPEITLDKVATTVTDPQVTISGTVKGASTVTVGGETVTVAADGKFFYAYKLSELRTYTVTVTAVSLAGNKTEQTITVTRTNGDAATVEAKLGAALLKAAATTDLTVTVKDKNGEAIKNAAFAVKVDGNIGIYASGKFTAADKPATGKITVTAANATPAVLEVAVVAGDLATLKVTGASTAKIGQAVTFTAKGYDAKDNEVALTGVQWSSTTGSVMGASTGEFVGTASGSMLVTAKAGGKEGTAIITVFGDAKALAMDIPTGLIANGKDTKTITVKVVDASGAVVSNSATDITLSLGGSSRITLDDGSAGTVTLSKKAVNGVATFTVYQKAVLGTSTDFKASTASLSAIGGTLTGAVGTIASVAPTVGSVVLTTDPGASVIEATTSSVSVNAKILDTTGIQINAPAAFTVTLSNSSTALGTLSSAALYVDAGNKEANGGATLTLKQKEGDITVSGASSAGYTVTPVTFTTKTAGPAYRVVILSAPKDNSSDDGTFELTVAVQDASGTTKTAVDGWGIVAEATHESGDSSITKYATAWTVHGVATLSFNCIITTGLHRAGTWTFKVFTDGGLLNPAPVTAKVTPGVFHHLSSVTVNGDPFGAFLPADGTMTATLSVELQDQHDNVVTGATNAVTFKQVTPVFEWPSASVIATTGVDATGVTVNAVNGVASVTVTATIAEGADFFGASAKMADGTTSEAPLWYDFMPALVQTTIVGPAAKIVSLDAGRSIDVNAGSEFQARFGILDGRSPSGITIQASCPMIYCMPHNVVASDNGRTVTVDVIDSHGTVVQTLTATTKNGVATVKGKLTKADDYHLKASSSIDGSTKTAEFKELYVSSAAPASVALEARVSGLEQGSQVQDNIRFVAYDAYGNLVDADGFREYSLRVNGAENESILEETSRGVFRFTAPVGGPQAYTVSDEDGRVSLEWYDGHDGESYEANYVPVVATTITTYTAGPKYTLGLVKSTAEVTAGGDQVIQIGVYDGSGHLKTGENTLPITLYREASVPGGAWHQTLPATNGIAKFTISRTEENDTALAGTYVYATSTQTDMLTVSDIKVVVKAGGAVMVKGSAVNLEANGSSLGLVKFRVTDGYGNTDTTYSGTMKFTVDTGSSGATLLNSSAPIVNGVAIAQVQASNVPGTLTITPAIDGKTALPVETKGTVKVGALPPTSSKSTVSFDSGNANVYVVLRDVNGNPVTDWEANLSQVNSSGAQVGAAFTPIGNGVYTAPRAGTATGVRVQHAADAAGAFTLPYPPATITVN